MAINQFWKIAAIYRFDMGAYTKIFLKFPKRFWPVGQGKQFFVYASSRRGYYGMWQSFKREYPGANVLMVTVTDDESRRIEQQSDDATKAEVAAVLRDMFPAADVPAPKTRSTSTCRAGGPTDSSRAPTPTGPSASTATSTTSSGYVIVVM